MAECTSDRVRRWLGAVLLIIAVLVPVLPQEAEAATWTCGYAQTTRYGYGSATGSKLAAHYMRSDYCWTASSTKDGAITDHRAWEIGWTKYVYDVSVTGEKANKVGNDYLHTGYATAQFCLTGKLGLICAKADHYIKHTLKPAGKVSKSYPTKWNT